MAILPTGFDIGKPSVAAKYNGKLRRPNEKKNSERIQHILHNVYYQTDGCALINKVLGGHRRAQFASRDKTSPFWPRIDHAIRTPETQGGQRSVVCCGGR